MQVLSVVSRADSFVWYILEYFRTKEIPVLSFALHIFEIEYNTTGFFEFTLVS